METSQEVEPDHRHASPFLPAELPRTLSWPGGGDSTEKQRAEDALKQSEERLRLMIANIKDYSVITLDRQGPVTTWNGAAERITG